MGIPVSEIADGKCYLTALGQVRRVGWQRESDL